MGASKSLGIGVLIILLVGILTLASDLLPQATNTTASSPLRDSPTNAVVAPLLDNSGLPAYKALQEFPPYSWPATEASFYATQAIFRMTVEYRFTHAPPTHTPVIGIHDTDGPIVFPQYRFENVWSNYINGDWVVVFAGVYADNLAQGIVVFAWNSELYETPLQAGSVHIVAEDNYRLTLRSTDGTIFYFDIPARQFVESLTEVVPTITPITPSPTPTPTITPTFDPTWLTPWPTCTSIPPSTATREPCGP